MVRCPPPLVPAKAGTQRRGRHSKRSPDRAKRNPGFASSSSAPHSASLHAGYIAASPLPQGSSTIESVIATTARRSRSRTKQSIAPQTEARVDCFATLAMTIGASTDRRNKSTRVAGRGAVRSGSGAVRCRLGPHSSILLGWSWSPVLPRTFHAALRPGRESRNRQCMLGSARPCGAHRNSTVPSPHQHKPHDHHQHHHLRIKRQRKSQRAARARRWHSRARTARGRSRTASPRPAPPPATLAASRWPRSHARRAPARSAPACSAASIARDARSRCRASGRRHRCRRA